MKKLPHEDEIHRRAIRLARKVAKARWPPAFVGLRRQAVRAASSICLNAAEASWKSGKPKRQAYRIAAGELGELAAALELGGVRCWRRQVEELYALLLPLTGCTDDPPKEPEGCPLPSPEAPPRPPRDRARGRKERKGGGKFPPGDPLDYRFPRASGLPISQEEAKWHREWLADYVARYSRGEFDHEICEDQRPREKN